MPHISKDTLKTYENMASSPPSIPWAFQGQKNATVTVTFDKPFYAEVQLQVAGYIRTDVVVSPARAVDFVHRLIMAASRPKGIQADTITYAGRTDWKILPFHSASNHLEADINETGRGR